MGSNISHLSCKLKAFCKKQILSLHKHINLFIEKVLGICVPKILTFLVYFGQDWRSLSHFQSANKKQAYSNIPFIPYFPPCRGPKFYFQSANKKQAYPNTPFFPYLSPRGGPRINFEAANSRGTLRQSWNPFENVPSLDYFGFDYFGFDYRKTNFDNTFEIALYVVKNILNKLSENREYDGRSDWDSMSKYTMTYLFENLSSQDRFKKSYQKYKKKSQKEFISVFISYFPKDIANMIFGFQDTTCSIFCAFDGSYIPCSFLKKFLSKTSCLSKEEKYDLCKKLRKNAEMNGYYELVRLFNPSEFKPTIIMYKNYYCGKSNYCDYINYYNPYKLYLKPTNNTKIEELDNELYALYHRNYRRTFSSK